MPTAPVADEVNDDIFVELISVVHRQLRDEYDRLGIVSVDMKNGCLHHLGDVGAVFRRARIGALASRKTDLVVQHNVQGATGAVSPGLGHLEGFHHHTLPRKGRITMNDDGHN